MFSLFFIIENIFKKKQALLRIVFENAKNIILVLSKNCSYYLNLVFSMFSMFFRTKKTGNQTCFFLFFITKISF